MMGYLRYSSVDETEWLLKSTTDIIDPFVIQREWISNWPPNNENALNTQLEWHSKPTADSKDSVYSAWLCLPVATLGQDWQQNPYCNKMGLLLLPWVWHVKRGKKANEPMGLHCSTLHSRCLLLLVWENYSVHLPSQTIWVCPRYNIIHSNSLSGT